jgi:hypothetical protein
VLGGKLAELEAQIEQVKARVRARYTEALADVLEALEDEQAELVEQLNQASQQAASPLTTAWSSCKSLLDALDSEDARVRLRAAIRRIVEGIWCVFVGRERIRIAAVQVWFTGNGSRSYLIIHKPATGGAVSSRPTSWECRSFADAKTKGLDLRRPGHARRLERVLAEMTF